MKQASAETPLFTKTHDFLTWLMTVVNHFPKLHRHTVTKRLLDAALDFLECLLEANVYRGEKRLLKLIKADSDRKRAAGQWRLGLPYRSARIQNSITPPEKKQNGTSV